MTPVDLRLVIWLIAYLLKQVGGLTLKEMRRRITLPWQSASPSYTRWTKYSWILILLVIGMFSGVRSAPSQSMKHSTPGQEFGVHHCFTAYDCEHPTAVQALKLPAYCITRKTDTDHTNQTINPLTIDKDPYQLLQKATYHEFDAHQCIQTRSRFFYSCVWASHSIINAVPQTGRRIATSIDFCTQAVRTEAYVTVAGNLIALKTDGHPTYISETIAGELNVAGGQASCNGEDIRHNGKTLKQTMVLQETHFIIKKVRIRKNFDSGDLMIVETGTTIPANLVKPGGFSIDSGTYIIPQIRTPCAYQIIKTFKGTAAPTNLQDDLIITSQKDQVHIHAHGMLNPPPRCPIQGTYRKTGHPNIVVFQPSEGPISTDDAGFNPIDARQVSIPNMITLKVECALYKTSKKFGLVHNIFETVRMFRPQTPHQWRTKPSRTTRVIRITAVRQRRNVV